MTFPPVFNPKATLAKSHVFDLTTWDILDAASVASITREISLQLVAETQRLQRLLPSAPTGYYWELSIETCEDAVHNTLKYRAVYRLEKTK